jgi:hypothetical protein
MKVDYEEQYKRKKIKTEFGYALMWLFTIILICFFPMFLQMKVSLLHVLLSISAAVGLVIKLVKGVKMLKSK